MTTTIAAERPCHTGPAAAVCSFDLALLEAPVDTGELLAVTHEHMCTCISCGAPWGQPHQPGCPQTSFGGGA